MIARTLQAVLQWQAAALRPVFDKRECTAMSAYALAQQVRGNVCMYVCMGFILEKVHSTCTQKG